MKEQINIKSLLEEGDQFWTRDSFFRSEDDKVLLATREVYTQRNGCRADIVRLEPFWKINDGVGARVMESNGRTTKFTCYTYHTTSI